MPDKKIRSYIILGSNAPPTNSGQEFAGAHINGEKYTGEMVPQEMATLVDYIIKTKTRNKRMGRRRKSQVPEYLFT